MALARENGQYDYNITINIDGQDYVVVRFASYEPGESISVTRVDTYDDNNSLIKTEYK